MGTTDRTKMLAAFTRALESRLDMACMVEAVCAGAARLAVQHEGRQHRVNRVNTVLCASRATDARERAYAELCNAMQLELTIAVFGG